MLAIFGNDRSYPGGGSVGIGNRFRMHGKQNDRHPAAHGSKNVRSLQSIHARHGGIQNNQIGFQFGDFFNGIQPVDGFTADCKLSFTVKITANQFSNLRTVIDNKNGIRVLMQAD